METLRPPPEGGAHLGHVFRGQGLRGRESATAHRGVNQGALAGPSAMVLRLVCVCARAVPRAPCPVCMRALRVSCPSLSVLVVVAIEATPLRIDRGALRY